MSIVSEFSNKYLPLQNSFSMAVYSFILTIMKIFSLKLQIILLVKPEVSSAGKALFYRLCKALRAF